MITRNMRFRDRRFTPLLKPRDDRCMTQLILHSRPSSLRPGRLQSARLSGSEVTPLFDGLYAGIVQCADEFAVPAHIICYLIARPGVFYPLGSEPTTSRFNTRTGEGLIIKHPEGGAYNATCYLNSQES